MNTPDLTPDLPPPAFPKDLIPVQPAAPGKALRRVSARLPFAGARTVLALILREMSSTYGRSAGGYLWVILEPVLGIAILSAIFSLGFKNPRLGSNFPIYYATGLLPYQFFVTVSGKVSQSITYSRQLLGYPRVTFTDVITARVILNVLTQIIVACIVLTGILVAFDTRTTLDMSRIVLCYAMVTALAVGIGTLNCFLSSMFSLWARVWAIATRPLFLISGTIFLYEAIPQPYRGWLWYNPLMHVSGEMRAAFYFSYDAPYVTPSYVFAISGICFMAGMLLLRRYHRDIREL